MKKIILMSLIAGALVSCNKKTETKKVSVPKPKTKTAEEILTSINEPKKGFECELEDLSTGETASIFYIDRSEANKDKPLYHKFYSITEGDDTVSPNIKLSTKQVWMVPYDSETNGIYKASPIVTKAEGVEEEKSENEDGVVKLQGASISFDSHTNEFEVSLTEKVIPTDGSATQINELSSFSITNCEEAKYKITVGLD